MVGDMQVYAAVFAYSQALVYSIQQMVAFIAHMGGVKRIVRRCHFRQLGNFLGITPTTRSINQSR